MGPARVLARDAGCQISKSLDRLGSGAPLRSETESALLRAVDELVGEGIVADQTWTVLSAQLHTQQILDLIFTAGSYMMLGWTVQTLGTGSTTTFVMLSANLRTDADDIGGWLPPA